MIIHTYTYAYIHTFTTQLSLLHRRLQIRHASLRSRHQFQPAETLHLRKRACSLFDAAIQESEKKFHQSQQIHALDQLLGE